MEYRNYTAVGSFMCVFAAMPCLSHMAELCSPLMNIRLTTTQIVEDMAFSLGCYYEEYGLN